MSGRVREVHEDFDRSGISRLFSGDRTNVLMKPVPKVCLWDLIVVPQNYISLIDT